MTGRSPDDGGTRRPKRVLRGRAVTFGARARDPDHEALKRCVCTAEENRKTSPNELGSFQRFERVVMLASEGAGPGAFGGVCAFKGHRGKEARQPGGCVTSRPVAVPSSGLDGPPRCVRREAGAALAFTRSPGLCGAAGPPQAPAARGGGGRHCGVPREGPGRRSRLRVWKRAEDPHRVDGCRRWAWGETWMAPGVSHGAAAGGRAAAAVGVNDSLSIDTGASRSRRAASSEGTAGSQEAMSP